MKGNSKMGITGVIALLLLITPILTMIFTIPYGSDGGVIMGNSEVELNIKNNKAFIENLGQWDERFHFRADTGYGHIGLGSSRMIFHLIDTSVSGSVHGDVLHYELLGSNDVQPIGRESLCGTNNYILGNEPSNWISGARSFKSAHYEEVWDGTDLDYHLGDNCPKYEFVLEPYADPSLIRIGLEGSKYAEVRDNELVIELESGRVVRDTGLKGFYADDPTMEIDVDFILLDERTFTFNIGEYDESRGLIIDPALIYSTFVGGTGMESYGRSVMDDTGNIYGVGTAWSYDFPFPPGAYSTNATAFGNAVVFKMDHTLSNLTYATYIGGESMDEGHSITMASNGEVIISGMTMSSDFPTTEGAYQRSICPEHFKTGYWDLFVLRLNNTGSGLVYSTYMGQKGTETFPLVCVDSSGNAVVTALSKMSNFTTTSDAYSKNYSGGNSDIILFVLNGTGEQLLYSTFIGGSEIDEPGDIVLVDDHLVYLTGRTNSTDFPTTPGAYDRTFNHNKTDENPFVICFNLTSNSMKFSTFVSIGAGSAIAIDDERNIYVGGNTRTWRFQTTKGVYQKNRTAGGYEGFVFKMDPSGSSIIFSTFIGGTHHEYVKDIALNSTGCIFLLGSTASLDFPITPGAYDNASGGSMDAFITVFLPDASNITYSTYIGSSDYDMPYSINLWSDYHVYISGVTYSATYPTTSTAYCPGFPGVTDFFISRLNCAKVFLPPDPPLNLTGRMYEDRISLEWKTPEFDGFASIIGYNISRGTTPGWGDVIGSTQDPIFIDTDFEVTETYYYFVTAYNRIGTSFRSNELTIMEKEPPVINDDLTPDEMVPGMELKFGINVTDNGVLEGVNVIYQVDDGPMINDTMEWDRKGDIHSYSVDLPDREFDLSYHFYAKDIKDNQVKTPEKVRHIRGPFLPIFLEDLTVGEATPISDLTFRSRIIDNWGIDEVFVEYWYNDGFHRNRTLDVVSGDFYSFDIVITGIPGDDLYYRFTAKDIHGNWNSTEISQVDVIDIEPPEIIRDLSPSQGTTGETIILRFEIRDDNGPLEVLLLYRFGDGVERSVNLRRTTGSFYDFPIGLPHILDGLYYWLEVKDGSNNTINSDKKMVRMIDNDLPVLLSDDSDDSCGNGETFRFDCNAEDNIDVADVMIEHWINNGTRKYLHLEDMEFSYLGAISFPEAASGIFRYRIFVEDTSGNIISGSVVNISIIDGIPPSLESIEDIATFPGWEIEVKVEFIENIDIGRVIWYGLPTSWTGLIWKGSFNETGENPIEILIEDINGNEGRTSFIITILSENHDTDGDGIPDLFEMDVGMSPLDPSDADQDIDGDDLSNLKEFEMGTLLTVIDSDNDGLPDGWEEHHGLDPMVSSDQDDPDGDGLSNLEEYLLGKDPNIYDEEVIEKDDTSLRTVDLILAVLILLGALVLILMFFYRNKKQ